MPRGRPRNQTPVNVIDERDNPIDAPTLGEAMSTKSAKTESVETDRPVKKGRRSWGRRDVLGVMNKDPNFTYRWVRKDAENLAHKLDQGWEYIQSTVNEKAVHTPTERMYDGVDLTSNKETRDSILMRLPNDLKAERDDWLNTENARVSGMLQQEAEKNMGNSLKGKIDIQGGQFKNIIE